MAGEGIAEGDWGEGMVGMTEPEAGHGGVKVIEGAAERGEIWEGEAPTADEVWGGFEGAKFSGGVEIGEVSSVGGLIVGGEVGEKGVFVVASFPAVGEWGEEDLADLVATGMEPSGEIELDISAHAEWVASKAVT